MSTSLESAPSPCTEATASSRNLCEKCHAAIDDYAVCPSCGYYAKLGHYVEIDQELEQIAVSNSEPFRLPKWSYTTIAGSLAIIAEAITTTLMLETNSVDRLMCSVLHLVVGIALMLIAQIRATFLTMMDEIDTTIVDCICFPPRAWGAIAKRLPKTASLVHMLCIGFLATLMALFVIGGIPWRALFTDE
ncbi:MAG: hypothetical protein AAF483_24910, partial [Planctomycetota bacterium]